MKLPKDFINWVLANPKLVDRKATSNPDLFVLKYKRKVFYDGLWNRFLEDCRGTIVDSEWNIVSLPFRKIYNYGIEKEAPKINPDTLLRVYKKHNGFMLSCSAYNGELLVSTTGSIDSSFVDMGKELLAKDPVYAENILQFCKLNDVTYLFEACHPNDPHIIAEEPGLYPIGYRYNDITRTMAHMWDDEYWDDDENSFYCTINELQRITKTCQHEGYVFYTETGVSAKIKSPHYLVKKLFMRGKDMYTLLCKNAKDRIDEEYYPLLDYLTLHREKFDVMEEQERRAFIEEFLSFKELPEC